MGKYWKMAHHRIFNERSRREFWDDAFLSRKNAKRGGPCRFVPWNMHAHGWLSRKNWDETWLAFFFLNLLCVLVASYAVLMNPLRVYVPPRNPAKIKDRKPRWPSKLFLTWISGPLCSRYIKVCEAGINRERSQKLMGFTIKIDEKRCGLKK